MQHVVSVLILTNDDYLWQHWRQAFTNQWMLARGKSIDDAIRWKEQGRTLVVVDHALKLWLDEQWPELIGSLQIIVASTAPNDTEGQTVLAAGARGYLHAYRPPSALERVLQHVSAGEIWIGESLLSRLLSAVSKELPQIAQAWQANLTAREVDVAERAALGHSNQLIANDLGIAERTVRAHLTAVFSKLEVTDRLMLTLKVHGINT